MKNLFKKPEHISKSFFWFTWFTMFSFIVGLAVKIYVAEVEVRGLRHAINTVDMIGWTDDSKTAFTTDLSMLILQVIIIVVTLVVYPMQMIEQIKLFNDPSRNFTKKAYKKMIKECVVFLTVFILLDLLSIVLLAMIIVKYNSPINAELIFVIASIFIPTPLVIGSMVWLKKLRHAGEVDMIHVAKS